MASDIFEEIFHSGSSGCVRTCVCGRTYFDEDDTTIDWHDGELEELQAKAKKEPEKYIPGDFSIPTIHIDTQDFVIDCPCNGAEKYEKFINQHDRQIAKYLNKKAQSLTDHALEIRVTQVHFCVNGCDQEVLEEGHRCPTCVNKAIKLDQSQGAEGE